MNSSQTATQTTIPQEYSFTEKPQEFKLQLFSLNVAPLDSEQPSVTLLTHQTSQVSLTER